MNLKETAEKIFNRKIESSEGIKLSDVENFEEISEIKLPKELKEFYTVLGNIKLFTDGHQHFVNLHELFMKDTKLVFLEENQSVVYWAVDLTDGFVYQTTNQDFNNDVEWYKEDFNLSEFLEMTLFFQCVMGDYNYQIASKSGFEYGASLEQVEYEKHKEVFKTDLKTNFEKVVAKKGISIYWKNDCIIMMFIDNENKIDAIFSSIKNEPYLDFMITNYNFFEL